MPEAARGSVKGIVLQSRLAFLRDERGEGAVSRTLAKLTEEDRRILSSVLLSTGWIPFETNERLDRLIAQEMGRGDGIFRTLGNASATHNLGAIHKSFVRDKDPHGLLKQAASIFRLYYDSGHRTYERLGDLRAVLRTHECLTFSRADCLTVVGWHERAIEMCGGKKVNITETLCRARGGKICEYVCGWE